MGISLSPFQPGAVNNQGGAPDALATLLTALGQGADIGVRGVEESGRNERASAQELGANSRAALQHKTDLANVALRQKEMDFKIAEQKSEQARIKMRGEAIQALLPWMQQMGQGQQAVDALGPQIGLTPSGGQQQWSDQPQQQAGGPPDLIGLMQSLPPEVFEGVLENFGKLGDVRKQMTRERISAKFQAPPNEDLPGLVNRLKHMSGAYAAEGDHAMVASLASDIGAIEPSAMKTDYEWFQTKDGKTVYLPKAEGSALRLGKPITTTGFGFGAAGPLGAMRAMAGIAGMTDADEKMRNYELKVAQKVADVTDKDYFQGQIVQMYSDHAKQSGIVGHIIPFFGTAAGTQMLERLNKTNPDYANYLQAAAQWALEESLLSNRPSDFRTKMDEFISAVKPGAKTQSIHDLWKSRAVRLDGYKKGLPALQAMFDRVVAASPGTSVEILPTPP